MISDLPGVLKKLLRFLKRRVVLAIIFLVSFLYCISSLYWQGSNGIGENVDSPPVPLPPDSFQWHHPHDPDNETSVKVSSCRNSVQGKVLIADDRGYVCPRNDVLSNGCCSVVSLATKRYSCETCQDSGCCSIYEHCISCCLRPEKKALLQRILGKASETFNILFASITDHFELCLTKCRTSSQSVQHENSYRDPRAKHCYGEAPPAVHIPSS